MGIKKGLRQLWIDDDDIRNRINGRVYAGRVPDSGKMPCVVVGIISTERKYHLGGEAGANEAIVQVDVYGDSISEVDQIAELIRNRTSGYCGNAGEEFISEAMIIRESDTAQQPKDGSSNWIYRHSRDFQVFYKVPVPTLD